MAGSVTLEDFTRSGQVLELAPVTAGVTLWWCNLDTAAANVERVADLLAPAEHARAARFGTEPLRKRWIAGRGTLRVLLGHVLEVPPARIEIQRGVRGRPELAISETALDFNVSHTDGVAVIGVARGARTGVNSGTRIGVDVERSDRDVHADRLSRKFLAPGERLALEEFVDDDRRARFLKYWTCKEAMSKATGDGLIAPFARIHVDLAGPRLLDGPPPYSPSAWTLHSAAAPAPYLVTVALWRRPQAA